MVFPIILTVLTMMSIPFVILNASFAFLYHGVSIEAMPWSIAALQAIVAGVALADAWIVSRCLFVFDWLNRPRSLFLTRPLAALGFGAVAGVLYAFALLRFVHLSLPGDPTMAIFDGGTVARAWWLGVGAAQGAALAFGTHLGLGFEVQRTANLEPPAPTLVYGSLEHVMVPIGSDPEHG